MIKQYNRTIGHYCENSTNTLREIAKKVRDLAQLNEKIISLLPASLRAHCHVVNFSEHHVLLATTNPSWATLLRFQIPSLVQQLSKGEGLDHITAISYKIIPTVETKKAPTLTQRRISADSARCLVETAAQISDNRISPILERLAKRASDK